MIALAIQSIHNANYGSKIAVWINDVISEVKIPPRCATLKFGIVVWQQRGTSAIQSVCLMREKGLRQLTVPTRKQPTAS